MNQRTFALIAVSIATLIYGVTYTIAKDVMPNYIKPYGFILLRVSSATLIFWTVGSVSYTHLTLPTICSV